MLNSILIQTLVLYGTWLLLSGIYTPMLLILGFISSFFVAWICNRNQLLKLDGMDSGFLFRSVCYFPWLAMEIIKSNIDVTRRIWTPSIPVQTQVIRVRADQSTAQGLVLHANSITLTPGTISINTSDGDISVHCLSKEFAEDMQRGEMNRRVVTVEGGEA